MNNYTILPKTHDKALLAQYYSLADAFVICSKSETPATVEEAPSEEPVTEQTTEPEVTTQQTEPANASVSYSPDRVVSSYELQINDFTERMC